MKTKFSICEICVCAMLDTNSLMRKLSKAELKDSAEMRRNMNRKQFLAAMYLRLSRDDKSVRGGSGKAESNSIGNQRKQILEYIHHDPELAKYGIREFCDDGYSGTSMDRPGMQKLLKEVKANHIRCIIVKDMSRFSRDYIEMGTYLDQIFPFMGIRFIALNDRYDSREHRGSTARMDTAFQTLLYDLYSKDLSVKVRASFESKCAGGEYVFGQVSLFRPDLSTNAENSASLKNSAELNWEKHPLTGKLYCGGCGIPERSRGADGKIICLIRGGSGGYGTARKAGK